MSKFNIQYGGNDPKPLKPLPLGSRLYSNKDGKLYLSNNEFTTSFVIKMKQNFGYAFYETINSIYYHPGVIYAAVKDFK